MKDEKPKRTRKTEPYPGLYPELHPRTRWEYFDQDYIDKLSPEEKQWLSNFNEEFVGGNFWHKNGDTIHTTPEHKTDCYRRNNSRNRDLYAINRTRVMGQETEDNTNKPGYTSEVLPTKLVPTNLYQEDAIIELMEAQDALVAEQLRKITKKT